MKTQIKITPAWLLWAVFLLLIMPAVSFAQQQKFEGKNQGHLYSEVLGKYLKDYTVYEMDTKAIAAFVKSHSTSAEFQLGLSGLAFQLNMEMNDLRSEDFKAMAIGTEGATAVPQNEEGTYKGKAQD